MRASNEVEGVYVHLPFCDGKCAYCAFYSVAGRADAIDAYLAALDAELALRTRELPGLAPLTLYIGGGTPTLLSGAQLRRLCTLLSSRLDLRRVEEWTVEANPGTLDDQRLAALKTAGVNRVSLGVQSLDDAVLARLGRRHTAAQAREACQRLRHAGFRNWSLDLIACVPGVTPRQWGATLRAALALGSPHLSVYALTSEEGSRLNAQVREGSARLLDDEAQLRQLHAAERVLRAGGLARYEISNYARPGFACRHNVSCWQGRNYLGVGCAASSYVNHTRWTNAADLDAYLAALGAGCLPPRETEALTSGTEALERMIFGLRQAEGVAPVSILAAAGRDDAPLGAHWAATLDRLRAEGLVRYAGERWRLTARGWDLADYVAVELMP
jgi:oxygen-independent coproporphyrinogen-3 oxidase